MEKLPMNGIECLKKANKEHLQHEEQASSNASHHDHEDEAHDVEAEQASVLLDGHSIQP